MTPQSTSSTNRERLWTPGHLHGLAGSVREIAEIIAGRQRLLVAIPSARFALASKLAELSRGLADYREQDPDRPETWLPDADGEVLRALLRLRRALDRIMPEPPPASWGIYLAQVPERDFDRYGKAAGHFGELVRQRFPLVLVNPWQREAEKARRAAEEPVQEVPKARAASRARPKLKPPTKEAMTAYRLVFVTGLKQVEAAKEMSRQLRRPVDQPTVSRWLKSIEAWVKAGNILPGLPAGRRQKPQDIDPEVIDMGERLERRNKRQRQRRDEE